jgi:hypothetical protein
LYTVVQWKLSMVWECAKLQTLSGTSLAYEGHLTITGTPTRKLARAVSVR